MITTDFKFVIEMFGAQGASLGHFPATVDWEPAREHVRLLALRGGKSRGNGDAVVQPIWAEELGRPYASGARVTEGGVTGEVPLNYFKSLTTEPSTALVQEGLLETNELFSFRLLAFRRTGEPDVPPAFAVQQITPQLRFKQTDLTALAEGVASLGDANPEDFPVFLPQRVLEEAKALTIGAGEVETGGILIGHLHRDLKTAEIAVVITEQIPARHTRAKSMALTFTAETWTAVQAAMDLRQAGEMMLGWWHSHPSFSWCNPQCPPERRKDCPLQNPFLSSDDVLLHRTVFSKGFHIALLANHANAGVNFALFGWRTGTVQGRSFHVLGRPQPDADSPTNASIETPTGDNPHATLCPT